MKLVSAHTQLACGLFLVIASAAAQQASDPAPAAAPAANGPKSTVEYSNCMRLAYPRESLRNDETGTVSMEFLINAEGMVVDGKVVKSSGFPRLDAAALAGIATCRFRPARVDGKPIQSWAPVQYVWSIE